MNLTNVQFSDFSDLVEKQYLELNQNFPLKVRDLFIEETIGEGESDQKRFDEFDVEMFAKLKNEGDDAASTSPVLGYNVTVTAERYAREINVTWESRRYNKYRKVYNQIVSLSHFIPQRMELNLTHILTFADSTAYTDMDGTSVDVTVGDGLALVSSVHTLTGSSSTYSNVVPGNPQFSQGALELAERIARTEILTNFGEQTRMNFNTIVTHDDPPTERAVRQVLESTADVDAAHEGVVNVHRGKYRHMSLPYLASTAAGVYDSAKAKRWFLIAAQQWPAYLGIWEKANLKMPREGNNGEDVHNDNWVYGTRGTFKGRAVSGRGLVMSDGTGA